MRFLKKKIALSGLSTQERASSIEDQDLAEQKSKEDFNLETQGENPQSLTITKPRFKLRNKDIVPDVILETRTRSGGRRREPEKTSLEDTKSTKTVVKNYGKAIASFAVSALAVPYLTPLLDQEGVKLEDFTKYIGAAKETIEGIDTFRALLLPKPHEFKRVISYKKIFQKVGEIFVKYFSVNWIFSGRMQNKQAHLKFRFKILRRIQNPELFTYLK